MTPTGDLTSKLDDPADPLNKHAEQIFDLATKFKYDQAKKVSVLWSKENISMSEVQGRLITLTKEKNRL